MDQEIVELFQVARDDGERLARALELTPFSRQEFNAAYSGSGDKVERCRHTVIRSFMGFGSGGVHSSHRTGFRGKSESSGTKPAHDWRNFPDAFRRIIVRMQGVVIECKPALEVIGRYDSPMTLFYVDPPYVHSTRKRVDAARGYRFEMSDDDHAQLAEALRRVTGMVVLSGYNCDLYRRLYAGWHRIDKTGAFADGARQRTESLWLSPNVPKEATLL